MQSMRKIQNNNKHINNKGELFQFMILNFIYFKICN